MRIVHVEVILVHPALLVLQVWAIVALVPNRNQDAGRFPCFQDCDHLVGFGVLEVLLHELVAPALVAIAFGSIQNRSTPFFASVLQPIPELVGDFGTLLLAGKDWKDRELGRRNMQLLAEKVMPQVNAAIGKSRQAAE